MKMLIDISKNNYNQIREGFYEDNCGIMAISIIDGTPIPDNATNGDIIKAMFPDAEVILNRKNTISWMYKGMIKTYPLNWWNAPYQKGGK